MLFLCQHSYSDILDTLFYSTNKFTFYCNTQPNKHAHAHTHARARARAHTHTHTHTHTRTHTIFGSCFDEYIFIKSLLQVLKAEVKTTTS